MPGQLKREPEARHERAFGEVGLRKSRGKARITQEMRCAGHDHNGTPSGQLVLKSGSITVTLDKNTGKAILIRKLLFWERKPLERSLSEIAEVRVDTAVEPASRAEFATTMLVMRTGGAWRLSAVDKKDAEAAVSAIRDFLGIS